MLTVGSMFSGVGLLDYGLHLAGLHHAWFAERDEFRRGILARRWPGALVLDDVRAVRADVVPHVDVIAGGFPCKGNSSAGKRNGFDHPETVLWGEMARAVRELRPRYVLVENVRDALSVRGGQVWATVLGDLAALGFDVEWDCLPAGAFGAPHRRDRVFALAVANADESRADAHASPGSRRDHAEPGAEASADAGRQRRQQERRGAPRDEGADEGRPAQRDHEPSSAVEAVGSRGVPVEWRDYEPAIRRWEAIHGPAPEPLVRRVDARGAARLERSRVSALGDGVQVQAGELCGRWIVNHAAESARAAA